MFISRPISERVNFSASQPAGDRADDDRHDETDSGLSQSAVSGAVHCDIPRRVRQNNGQGRVRFSAGPHLSRRYASIRASSTTRLAPIVAVTIRAASGFLMPRSMPEFSSRYPPTNAPIKPVATYRIEAAAADDPARQPPGREADAELRGHGAPVEGGQRLAVDLDADRRLFPGSGCRDPVVL